MGWEYIVAAIIAALAATGSAAATNKAQNKNLEGQAAEAAKERFRQAEIQRQADAETRAQIQQFTPEKQAADIQQAVADRTAATAPPLGAPAPYQAATPSAPVEVQTDMDRRLGDVAVKAKEEAARRAKLSAFGDVSQAQDFAVGRMGENLRQFQLQSAGQSRILPFAMREHLQDGRSYARGADAANLIGQVASMYAIGGGQKKPQTPQGGGASYGP